MIIDKIVSENKIVLPHNKEYSLQFLPEKLLTISEAKNLTFNGEKLKTSYIIDIVHNLLLKYYFRKENKFHLSSLILKERYGYLYNYYINYLKNENIIILKRNHLKGSNARVYSLNESIFTGKIYRYKNYDKVLLKKYLNKHVKYEIDNNTIIDSNIKKKLISDLYSVNIQYDRSIFYLDSLKNEDTDIYQRNKYSVDAISDSHIFYHFDSYGRMHTNFTILKSFIRKNCLLIDGEDTCEIDIKNSQPLFLSKLIKQTQTRWVKEDEFKLFCILVENGNYYQYLIDNLNLKDKSSAKELTYKVFFGQNRANSIPDKMFHKLFPTIHNFIKLYKKEYKDYKILAYDLQKAESELIFNRVIKKIMNLYPEVKVVTVHDSIIIQNKWKNEISSLFFSEIFQHFETI
jgi:hypothetical protein